MSITVRVRDGRLGHDPKLVRDDGLGEVLATFEVERPYDIGDRVELTDGTVCEVIGGQDAVTDGGYVQDVTVGDVFPI